MDFSTEDTSDSDSDGLPIGNPEFMIQVPMLPCKLLPVCLITDEQSLCILILITTEKLHCKTQIVVSANYLVSQLHDSPSHANSKNAAVVNYLVEASEI